MSEVIRLPPAGRATVSDDDAAASVRTDAVHVVFTTGHETLGAVRVASTIGRALGAPVVLVHFRPVPYPLSVDAPSGISPTETGAFIEQVRSVGNDVRIRVYLCRAGNAVMPLAFKPHSIVVIGGHRSWLPTASERLRRRLEKAGHFVVFVEEREHAGHVDA